jgi:hypothetical protein
MAPRRPPLPPLTPKHETRVPEATVAAAVADARAEIGAELVPVLADRSDRARAAAEAAFPDARHFAPVATDGDGWNAGRVFADLVDLAVGPSLP